MDSMVSENFYGEHARWTVRTTLEFCQNRMTGADGVGKLAALQDTTISF